VVGHARPEKEACGNEERREGDRQLLDGLKTHGAL
jgi:hypothetical protein